MHEVNIEQGGTQVARATTQGLALEPEYCKDKSEVGQRIPTSHKLCHSGMAARLLLNCSTVYKTALLPEMPSLKFTARLVDYDTVPILDESTTLEDTIVIKDEDHLPRHCLLGFLRHFCRCYREPRSPAHGR